MGTFDASISDYRLDETPGQLAQVTVQCGRIESLLELSGGKVTRQKAFDAFLGYVGLVDMRESEEKIKKKII